MITFADTYQGVSYQILCAPDLSRRTYRYEIVVGGKFALFKDEISHVGFETSVEALIAGRARLARWLKNTPCDFATLCDRKKHFAKDEES